VLDAGGSDSQRRGAPQGPFSRVRSVLSRVVAVGHTGFGRGPTVGAPPTTLWGAIAPESDGE